MSKTVLIVDDEPNIAISVEFLMQREGYQILVAHDGEQGLAMIREHHPDLVLLDVMMPKMNGFEVCQTVREDPAMTDICIVMLTAKGRAAEVEKGMSLGADAYIPKPFATSELVAKVHELLSD